MLKITCISISGPLAWRLLVLPSHTLCMFDFLHCVDWGFLSWLCGRATRVLQPQTIHTGTLKRGLKR